MNTYIKRIAKWGLSPIRWVNKLVMKTNWYTNVIPDKNNFPTNEWYRENLNRNYDVVNVGSSSALYAFDYSETKLKAFNWAMQPQSMDYSFKVLQNFHSILKSKGVVLIPFSPFSGLSVAGKWTKTSNDKYYYLLDHTLVDDYQSVAKRRKYPLVFQTKQAIKRLLKDIPPPRKENCNMCYSAKDFSKDAENWIKGWTNEFQITNLNEPLSEENKEGMEKRLNIVMEMINYCLTRDLCPVLVIPPMHPALASKFSNEFRENYIYSFIRKANTANIPVCDYIDHPEFKEDIYYRNSFFLSEKGAKKFTQTLLTSLNIEQS